MRFDASTGLVADDLCVPSSLAGPENRATEPADWPGGDAGPAPSGVLHSQQVVRIAGRLFLLTAHLEPGTPALLLSHSLRPAHD